MSTGVVSRPMATTTAMASVNARPRRSSGLARIPLRRTSVAFTGGGLDLLGQVIGQRVGGVVEQAGVRTPDLGLESQLASDCSRSASRSLIGTARRGGWRVRDPIRRPGRCARSAGMVASSRAWEPSPTMRPPSRKATRSASSMVDTRWATTSVVVDSSLAQALEDLGLDHRIDRRGGVVEDEHPGLAQQSAGQRDALALAAREGDAPLAHHGGHAQRHLPHEPVGPGDRERAAHLVVGDVGAQRDVLPERVGEQERLLEHQRHRRRQRLGDDLAQVDATHLHHPGGGVGQVGDQLAHRRLARAGRPDQGHDLARFDPHGDALEHQLVGHVAERDVFAARCRAVDRAGRWRLRGPGPRPAAGPPPGRGGPPPPLLGAAPRGRTRRPRWGRPGWRTGRWPAPGRRC